MKKPQKLFSVAFEFSAFEELRGIAKNLDISTGELIRDAVNSFLEKAKKRAARED